MARHALFAFVCALLAIAQSSKAMKLFGQALRGHGGAAPEDVTHKYDPAVLQEHQPHDTSHASLYHPLHYLDFLHPLAHMLQQLDTLSPAGAAVARTAVDVHDTEKAYQFVADVPGLARDDVSVAVHDGVLTISGERRFEKATPESAEASRRVERSFGKFTRAFSLPRNADPDAVTANVTRGVLTVSVPKKDVKVDPKGHVNIEWSEL